MDKNKITDKVKEFIRTSGKVIKTALTPFRTIIIIFAIVIIFIAGAIYTVTLDDASYKDSWTSTPYASGQYTGNISINTDGSINTSMTAQELWDKMIENNSRVNEYLNEPEELLKLMNAELITKYPDTRANPDEPIDWDTLNNDINSNKVQGIIKFRRAQSDGTTARMTFVNSDQFYEWVELYSATGDENARQNAMTHFTIEESTAANLNFSKEDITTDISNAIVEASYSTPSRGPGLCQAWVRHVYKNAGLGDVAFATAYEAYKANVVSTDMSNIPVGAAVYGTGTSYAGHVGIYIGNGMVRDSITRDGRGVIVERTIEEWLSWQTNVIDGKQGWLGWGWQAGVPTTTTEGSNDESNNEDTTITSNKSYSVVVATWTETQQIVTSDDPDVEEVNVTNYTMTTQKVNYQAFVSGYTMPFSYLWSLLVMGREKEFVLELADLVQDSEIEITIYDTLTTVTEVEEHTYEKEVTYTETDADGNEYEDTRMETFHMTETLITRTNTLNISLNRANVWIVDYTQEYVYGAPETIVGEPEEIAEGVVKTTTVERTKYTASPPNIIEKTDKNSTEPNFVTIFLKRDHFMTYNNILSAPDWLFEILENNQDTANMVDLTRYLLYKATGEDFGVTELDESFFKPGFQGITTGAEGGLSLTTTMFTKEEFRQAMQAYYDSTNNQDFYNNFLAKVDELYDTSIANNINPELVVITARGEGNFRESGGSYNYWGLGVPNGSNVGNSYTSLADGIAGYASVIHSYETGSYATMILTRYQQRKDAGCNPLGYGLPGTLSGMQSIYSYLGKHEYGSSGAGGYYYMDPDRAGVTAIYATHEEFLAKCQNSGLPEHAEGTETTIWEQGQYTAWQVEQKLQYWDEIFGAFGDRSSVAE